MAQARLLPLSDLDLHTGVETVQVTHGNKVSVVWPDQHVSVFEAEWLKKRCFSRSARRAMQEELFLNERSFFDSSLRLPSADFDAVLSDDRAALDWLLDLRRVGIVRLQGAPPARGQVARLAQRVGYLRMTFYGPTWQVQDKPQANNVAYTSGGLSLHTDYPALHYAPGVQFLHCVSQAGRGGGSEVVDGFHAAEQLRLQQPEAFSRLTTLPTHYTDTGEDHCAFRIKARHRIIQLDPEGRVERINYNNATRDSVLDLDLDQVQPSYEALKAFVEVLNRPQNLVSYRMEPGDIVTFDNWRLLHGRRSFVSLPGRPRLLEGAYLDWDEVMSRLRVLRRAVGGGGA
ncbi:gamma-butyrobetaine dioxygenase isoform 2-T3 [Menidia menidia]